MSSFARDGIRWVTSVSGGSLWSRVGHFARAPKVEGGVLFLGWVTLVPSGSLCSSADRMGWVTLVSEGSLCPSFDCMGWMTAYLGGSL